MGMIKLILQEEVCSTSCTPLVHRTETDVVEPEKSSEKVTCGWEEGDVFHCPRLESVINAYS